MNSIQRGSRWVRITDQLVLCFVLFPIMLFFIFWNPGQWGFPIGFCAAMAGWFIYKFIRSFVIIIWAKRYIREHTDHDVMEIVEEDRRTGDHGVAVAKLRSLIDREGESSYRDMVLANFLSDLGEYEDALEWVDRARLLPDETEDWMIDLIEVACLRGLGRYREALEMVDRIIGEVPLAKQPLYERAKLYAECGRCEEAREDFASAKKITGSWVSRLATGREFQEVMKKEARETEEFIQERCSHNPETE